jgi:hypothetical protein
MTRAAIRKMVDEKMDQAGSNTCNPVTTDPFDDLALDISGAGCYG